MAYGQPTNLNVRLEDGRVHRMLSQEGVRQGDPLAPFFFALGLQAVLIRLKTELAQEATFQTILEQVTPEQRDTHRLSDWDFGRQQAIMPLSALLDDIRFMGPWPVVTFAVTRFQEINCELQSGLQYSIGKCCLWSPKQTLPEPLPVEANGEAFVRPEDGIVLLGSPIGTNSFEQSTVAAKADSHRRLLARIVQLSSSQLAYLLLRYCAAQRFTYLLRTVPPSNTLQGATAHDQIIRSSLCQLLQVEDISEDRWNQATLRVAEGGLGLGKAERERQAAYLGSSADCLRHFATKFPLLTGLDDTWLEDNVPITVGRDLAACTAYVNTLVTERQQRNPLAESVLRDIPRTADRIRTTPAKLQHRLTSLEINRAKTELMQNRSLHDRAQLISQSGPGAGGFLTAIPAVPELCMSSSTMLLSLRRWLRLPLIDGVPQGDCVCSTNYRVGSPLTTDHLLRCHLHGVATSRHDNLRRALRQMAAGAGLMVEEEPRGLPGFGQGGGDLLFVAYTPEADAMADVTVVCEQREDLVTQAAVNPGHAAAAAASRKVQRYGAACQALALQFLPLVLELDGAFGQDLQQFFMECRRRTRDVLDKEVAWGATFTQFWQQRLSIVLREGTARAVRRVVQANIAQRDLFLQAPDYDALARSFVSMM